MSILLVGEQHKDNSICQADKFFKTFTFVPLLILGVQIWNVSVVIERMTRLAVCWVLSTLVTLCFESCDMTNFIEYSKFPGKIFSFDSLRPLTLYCLKPNTSATCLLKCLDMSTSCMGVMKDSVSGCCQAFFSPGVVNNLGHFEFIHANSSMISFHRGMEIFLCKKGENNTLRLRWFQNSSATPQETSSYFQHVLLCFCIWRFFVILETGFQDHKWLSVSLWYLLGNCHSDQCHCRTLGFDSNFFWMLV